MEQGGALTEQVSTSRRKNSGSKGAEMEQEGRQHTGTLGRLTVFGPASFADEVLYLASRIWNWLSLFLL